MLRKSLGSSIRWYLVRKSTYGDGNGVGPYTVRIRTRKRNV